MMKSSFTSSTDTTPTAMDDDNDDDNDIQTTEHLNYCSKNSTEQHPTHARRQSVGARIMNHIKLQEEKKKMRRGSIEQQREIAELKALISGLSIALEESKLQNKELTSKLCRAEEELRQYKSKSTSLPTLPQDDDEKVPSKLHKTEEKLLQYKSILPTTQDEKEDEEVDASSSLNRHISPLPETPKNHVKKNILLARDILALEVGYNAQEHLEDSFQMEVNVLNRQKFNDIPEFSKSDFTISHHIGMGSYSDVFEVVVNYSDVLLRHNNKKKDTVDNRRRPSRTLTPQRRATTLSSSITTATLSRPLPVSKREHGALAMKCLRPQIRSDEEQFRIGAEDLVHETAILANLSHPNIIKLHGRASGSLTDAFRTNDGYFILLDKLECTLLDRIDTWLKKPDSISGPSVNPEQLNVAHSMANAMSYLHSKKILFRDLKPENVGFDSNGVLKLFDFGFAIVCLDEVFEKVGTPRYMAPENALETGYSLPADVYSFGILLWEICALNKPFTSIKTAEEFEKLVCSQGKRPTVAPRWPKPIKQLMKDCWSSDPAARPLMSDVETTLSSSATTKDDKKKIPPRRILKNRLSSSFIGL